MVDKIIMKGLKFYGYHGVFDFEKVRGQNFIVDIEMSKDLSKAGKSDDLNQTINYAEVYQLIKEKYFNEAISYDLIETVAEKIAETILTNYEVEKVAVEVKKPEIDLGGEIQYFGVKIKRKK